MKRLIAIAIMTIVLVAPKMVSAETVETCSTTTSGYGSGTVCGAYTVKEHVVLGTGADENQMIKLLLTIAGGAVATTLLYKLTYKTYILG